MAASRALLGAALMTTLLGACVGTQPEQPSAPRPSAPPAAEARPATSAPQRPRWRAARVLADAPPTPARQITVAPGDTLLAIARRETVGVGALAAANGLVPPYSLTAGRVLVLPAGRHHPVRAGETLSTIASAYRADWRQVAAANALGAPYTLEVGDLLFIPDRSVAARGATVEERARRNRLDVDDLLAGAAGAPANRAPAARTPATRAPAAAAPAAVAEVPAVRLDWPLEGRLVSTFGRKPGGRVNDGINIAAVAGAPVRAAAEGQVIYAGTSVAAFGGLILIRHAGGWVTAYGHNEALLVARGETVTRGQTIARAGATGEVDSPQLHFEVRRGRTPVDPLRLLPARPAG